MLQTDVCKRLGSSTQANHDAIAKGGDSVSSFKHCGVAAIKAHPDAKVVAFVHAETSTGVRSDAETLCRMAKDAGMLVIVDAVTPFEHVANSDEHAIGRMLLDLTCRALIAVGASNAGAPVGAAEAPGDGLVY